MSKVALQSQYKFYNDVIVTIFEGSDEYVISNINKSGLCKPNCQTHLTSISIKAPVYESSVGNSLCYTGTISLIDYKSTVFKKFLEYKQKSNGKPFPNIKITIRCYTGDYEYNGVVDKWDMSFSGSVPTITINWTTVGASTKSETDYNVLDGDYFSVSDFIYAAYDVCGNGDNMSLTIRNPDGTEVTVKGKDDVSKKIDDCMIFTGNDNKERTDGTLHHIQFSWQTVQSKSKHFLVKCFDWLSANTLHPSQVPLSEEQKKLTNTDSNAKTKVGFIGEVDGSQGLSYIMTPNGGSYSKSTDEGKLTDKLVFVQNGKWSAYEKVTLEQAKAIPDGEYIVIPMTSFSFAVDWANVTFTKEFYQMINGNYSLGNEGSETTSAPAKQANDRTQSDAKSSTTISFECWNVMSFARNNSSAKVHVLVFDEDGNLHPSSGVFTVTEADYDVNGAVVKSKVTATKLYNKVSDGNVKESGNTTVKSNEQESGTVQTNGEGNKTT